MKRESDIMYIANDISHGKTTFSTSPDFNFNFLPKLVDYSFHDDSDDEEGAGLITADPVEELQSQLSSLAAPTSGRFTCRKVANCRNLSDRANLKLKLEETEETLRNERLMTRLNDALSASRRVYDSERPAKKRRIDMTSVVERLLTKKGCRLLRRQRSVVKTDEQKIRRSCILTFLKKRS